MKIIKVLKICSLGIIILLFLVISFMFKIQKDKEKHYNTIKNFPVVEGKLYTDKPIIAPISGEESVAVLLKSTGSYDSYYPIDTCDSSLNTNNFFFVSKDVEIEVEGKRYKLVGNTIAAFVSGGIKTKNTPVNKIIDSRYVGLDDILDCNFNELDLKTENGNIKIVEDYKSYNLEEFIFKNGDNIKIKAHIKDNKVYVLTWEDVSKRFN